MKKIISLLITLFIISETAFAFTSEDLANARYNVYKQYEGYLKNATMKSGESFESIIDKYGIIPEVDLKYDGGRLFESYVEGNFFEQLDTMAYVFYCRLKDSNSITIVDEIYSNGKEIFSEETDLERWWKTDFAFNDDAIAALLTEAGVTSVSDVRLSSVGSSPNTGVFLYLNTDKGEFIILSRDLDRAVPEKTPLNSGKLYSASIFVDYCWAVRELEAQREAEEHRKEQSETRWVLQDGEAIKITPVPTKAPAVTAEPENTPRPTAKPTVEPSIAPTETAEPTVKPTETVTPKQDKTLTVRTKGKITITIDTDEVEFTDAQPFVDENDRTQAPIRTVAEMLNSTVSWDNDTRTVTITNKNGDVITLIIDSPIMSINGKDVYMDTQAIIKDNRTYIPVRFIAEAMNMTVKWGD